MHAPPATLPPRTFHQNVLCDEADGLAQSTQKVAPANSNAAAPEPNALETVAGASENTLPAATASDENNISVSDSVSKVSPVDILRQNAANLLHPEDLPLVATLFTISNPAISLWRGGAVPCTDAVKLAVYLSTRPMVSSRNIGNLPDVLVPPWLKLMHMRNAPMLPVHACALFSTALAQMLHAEPIHLHPAADQVSVQRMVQKHLEHSQERSAAMLAMFTDVPIVLLTHDTHALRAGILMHALHAWFPNSPQTQMSRKKKLGSRGTTIVMDGMHRNLLDVAALARMLDMRVAESTTITCAATGHLAKKVLEAAKIQIRILDVKLEKTRASAECMHADAWEKQGSQVHSDTSAITSPKQLIHIATDAAKKFNELEKLLHRSQRRGCEPVCMSSMYGGRADWQREERLWGLRWLQVLFQEIVTSITLCDVKTPVSNASFWHVCPACFFFSVPTNLLNVLP